MAWPVFTVCLEEETQWSGAKTTDARRPRPAIIAAVGRLDTTPKTSPESLSSVQPGDDGQFSTRIVKSSRRA